jgi:FKBP-type peptidyl-prolyl cis-trans isomerase
MLLKKTWLIAPAAALLLGTGALLMAQDKPAADKPADKPAAAASDKTVEKTIEKPADKPAAGETGKTTTTASGLKITTVQEAKNPGALAGDIVWVHYTGKLTSGKVFDSSVGKGKPFKFTLGQGEVIKGWDEGIVGMKIGEKRQLTIPPDLGYGERGAGNDIPPGATLMFDVEMIGIARPANQ